MNFLCIDPAGCGLYLCFSAAVAGHDVRWYIKPSKPGEKILDGKGFPGVKRVDDWRSHMVWAKSGLVWTTHNGSFMKELDRFKAYGWPIFGPTEASARLEIQRSEGMKAFKDAGVSIPPFKTFKSLADALRFAMSANRPYVFKTMGDEEDKSLSYVSSDPADLAGWLESKIKKGLKLKGECMLQEKVEGIEMGVSAWMGPDGFLPERWNINFEYKKLMSGNYGPNTGEQGTIIQYEIDSKLANYVLKPFEGLLKKLGHIGDAAVNCIIGEDGVPYPLEWTMRPGWPFTQIVQETHSGDPIQWMKDLLSGKDTLEVKYDVGMGVVLAIPPYPRAVDDDDEVVGLPMQIARDVEEYDWPSIHPWQLMLEKGYVMENGQVKQDTIYKTTGTYVAVVSGTGKRVKEAYKDTFDTVKKISVPNMMVRDDIGKDLEEKLTDLHEHGYAINMRY